MVDAKGKVPENVKQEMKLAVTRWLQQKTGNHQSAIAYFTIPNKKFKQNGLEKPLYLRNSHMHRNLLQHLSKSLGWTIFDGKLQLVSG